MGNKIPWPRHLNKLTLFSNYLLILILSQTNVCDYPRIRLTEFLVLFSIAAIGMN